MQIPGHAGPHPEAYHKYVYETLVEATTGLRPGSTAYHNAVVGVLDDIAQQAATPGTQINIWLVTSP